MKKLHRSVKFWSNVLCRSLRVGVDNAFSKRVLNIGYAKRTYVNIVALDDNELLPGVNFLAGNK